MSAKADILPSPTQTGGIGLANFAFRVDDVTRVAALIKQNGGSVLETSHATLGTTEFVFCSDPDGVRLELVGLAKNSPPIVGRRRFIVEMTPLQAVHL